MNMEDQNRLASWLNDTLPEAELQKLRQEEDYTILEKIKQHSSELQVKDFDADKLYQTILSKRKTTNVRTLNFKKVLQIAAIVVVFLGLGGLYLSSLTEQHSVANGAIKSFTLPDQSEVMLHSGSEITYKTSNWENNRTLDLQGEAYFKVAKGKQFDVVTSEGVVSVLGTQFNVKARNNRIDVTCYEGKVHVKHLKKSIIITQGQTIAFANNTLIFNHSTEALFPSWISKELQFEKARPQDVLDELKQYFNIEIAVNSLPNNELFTGKLPGNNADVALQLFAASYHLKVVKNAPQQYSFEPLP